MDWAWLRGAMVAGAVGFAFLSSLRANVNHWLRAYLAALLLAQAAGELTQWLGWDATTEVYLWVWGGGVLLALSSIIALTLSWNMVLKTARSQAVMAATATALGVLAFLHGVELYEAAYDAPLWPAQLRFILLDASTLLVCSLVGAFSIPFLRIQNHPTYQRHAIVAKVLCSLWLVQSLFGFAGLALPSAIMAWLPAVLVVTGMITLGWKLRPKFSS